MNFHLHFQIREQAAIRELVGVTKDTASGGPLQGAHVHIVHLSDSSASLDMIKVIYAFWWRYIRFSFKSLIYCTEQV